MARSAHRLIPLALAALAAVSWGLSFEARPAWVLPWVALVPAFLLLGCRRSGGWLFLAGWGSWVVALRWIVATVATYGGLPVWVGAAALALLAAILALPWLLLGWLGAPLWRRGGVAAMAGLPLLWVATEVFRGWFLTGFPWNLAAYSVTDVPGALALSSLVGAFGVSWLVAAVNVAVALSARESRPWPAVAAAVCTTVVLAMAARWATPAVDGAGAGDRSVAVRIVQPNIENLTAWEPALVEAGYRRLLELSLEACDEPALLIWPESAAWPRAWQTDGRLQDDLAALSSRGCAVLLNTVWRTGEKMTNAALLVDGRRAAGRYDKRHLVPFGEYVPVWLPVPGTLARNVGSFDRGFEPTLIGWEGLSLGVAVCYEIVFAGEVQDLVRRGADVLITMTNDAWYGDTAAPWQHFRAARWRAAESGRTVVRAAITGISGWISPDGSVRERLGVGETGILRGRLAPASGRTLYARLPWWIPGFSIAWLMALVAARVWSRRPASKVPGESDSGI